MSFKNDFEKLIDQIEQLSTERISAIETASKVSNGLGINPRDLGTSFSFITRKPLVAYIKERKLMAAYQYLIDTENAKISEAVDISGFDNQSSFSKRFKKEFNMSPKQAVQKKDANLYKSWITWDYLESDENTREEVRGCSMNEKTVFDVTLEDYQRISEILELQSLYGLSEEMSKAAFEFSKEFNRPLDKSFQYFDEFAIPYKSKEYIECFEDDGIFFSNEEEYIKEDVMKDLSDPEMCYLFFDAGFSESIFDIINKARGQNEDVRNLSKTALRFLASDINGYYGLKSANYYDEHANEEYTDKNLDEYIQKIEEGGDYEIAFESILTDAEMKRLLDYAGSLDSILEEEALDAMIERNKDIIEDGYTDLLYDVYYD